MLRLIFNDDIIDRNSSGFDQNLLLICWCHMVPLSLAACISMHFLTCVSHLSLGFSRFPGTQVVALQLCRRCQELARCNALLNS